MLESCCCSSRTIELCTYAELDAAYNTLFRSLHLAHFSEAQLAEAAKDGELSPALLAAAAANRKAVFAKVRA